MAEVVGTIASVTSLIKAGRAVGNYIKEFRHAPRFVFELQVEVEGFNITLEDVERHLRDPDINSKIASARTHLVFGAARQTLRQLEETLVMVVQSPGAEVSRSRWVYYESTCRELKGQLAAYREPLNSIVFAAQSELLRNILCMKDQPLAQFTVQAVTELDGKAELVLSNAGSSKQPPLESFQPSSATAASISSPPPTYEDVKAEDSYDEEVLQDTEKFVSGKQNCDQDCRCMCHEDQRIIPGRLTNPRRASAPSLVARFVRTCTFNECGKTRRRSTGSIVVPSQVLNRVVSFKVGYGDIHRRIFRKEYFKVAENSDQIRYASSGNLQALILLLDTNRATINDFGPDGWSLLISATYRGHLNVVEELVKRRADPRVVEVGTRRAVDFAQIRAFRVNASQTERDIAKLFQKMNLKSNFGFTPIHIAVLEAYDEDDEERPSLLQLINCMEIAKGAPANQNWGQFKRQHCGTSPLYGKLIEYFSKSPKKAKQDREIIDIGDGRQRWSPLHWALYTGRLEAMRTLIAHGADQFLLTNQNRNSLHQAAESRLPDVMRFALNLPEYKDERLDIDHKDLWGDTPLHVAVAGSSECVQMLLDHGAKRDIRDDEDQVPLHLATLSMGEERNKIIDILSADQGEHINAQDLGGRTPIFNVLNTPDCVALLLSRKADLSRCDNEQRTVIHHACMENQVDSLRLLLRNCKPALAVSFDKNGDIPLAKAFQFKNGACVALLLERDAIGDLDERDHLPLAHRAAMIGSAQALQAAFDHQTYKKGREDGRGRTVEMAAIEAGTYKVEVRDLILRYESKGMRVDRKGKGRSVPDRRQAGPSAADEARMVWASYR